MKHFKISKYRQQTQIHIMIQLLIIFVSGKGHFKHCIDELTEELFKLVVKNEIIYFGKKMYTAKHCTPTYIHISI